MGIESQIFKLMNSKSNKMFKELGYTLDYTQWGGIRFYKNDENVIIFNLKDKSFIKSGEYDGMCDSITIQELEAINQFCKEKGWITE